PARVRAVQGSTLSLAVDSAAAHVTIEQDGEMRAAARGPDGRFTGRVGLATSGYVLVAADDGRRRLMPIVVSPDALPSVRLTAPGRDLVYADAAARVAFDARAIDDFGLRSLSLQCTKVSGSGEQCVLTEGGLPLTVGR